MTFTENEFFVGMIAYFTIDQLRASGNIRRTGGSPNASARPFVAYAEDDAGDTYWTPLTTQETQSKRTAIEKQWIHDAAGRLLTDPVVVNDGGHTYAGQAAEFAALSHQHDNFAPASRPRITSDGVAAVRGAVAERGGLLPASRFQTFLEHARAAYLFAVRSLPDPAALQAGSIRMNGMEFAEPSQIESMLVELGWAFFCRYESCLEAELKRQRIALKRRATLIDWLKSNNVVIPEELKPGLEVYRKILNKLHHEDGASLDDSPDLEIHLMPEHMQNFYDLFSWCGQKAACAG